MPSLTLSLSLDSAAVICGRNAILTPSQIWGSALKHGYQGKNVANSRGSGVWNSWADEGNIPVALIGENKPLIVAAGINGQDCAQFVSASQLFFQSASSLLITQPFTVGKIFKPSAVPTTGNSRFLLTQDGGGAAVMQYNDGSPAELIINAGGTPIVAPALGDSNVMAIMAHYDGANSFVTINRGSHFGLITNIGTSGLGVTNFGLSPGASPDLDINDLLAECWFATGSGTSQQFTEFQAYLCNAAGV